MATVNTTHAFNLASPYAAELADIERRQRLAEMLQAQSQTPIERFSYQGIEAPISPLSGLAKALQSYTSMKMAERGINEQKALQEKVGMEAQDWITNLAGKPGIAGTPEQIYTPTSADYEENPNLAVNATGQATVAAQPGLSPQARTPAEQQAYLFQGMRNPYSSQLASTLMTKNIEDQQNEEYARKVATALRGGATPTAPSTTTGVPVVPQTSTTGAVQPPSTGAPPLSELDGLLTQRRILEGMPNNPMAVRALTNINTRIKEIQPSADASARLKFDKEVDAFKRANPTLTVHEDAGGLYAFNPQTGATTYVLNPDGTRTQGTSAATRLQSASQFRQTQGLAERKFAFEQANPGYSYREDQDGKVFAINQKTNVATPVTLGSGGQGPGVGSSGAPTSVLPSATSNLGAVQQLVGKGNPQVQKDLLEINQQMSTIQGAINAVKTTPSAFSFQRGAATDIGSTAESLAGRMDTKDETQARAYVFNNVSSIIKERAGTAQSVQELSRINSFLPGNRDNAEQIQNKLQGFMQFLKDKEAGTKGTPIKPTVAPQYATNGSERIVSTDGGLTWQPAK